MTPKTTTSVLHDHNTKVKQLPQYKNGSSTQTIANGSKAGFPWKDVVWKNVFGFIILHIVGLYGLFKTFSVSPLTIIYNVGLVYCAALGITAGAHRLWTHRTFNAKWPLRLFLTFCQTVALQNDIHEWVRDHRVHHKYVDTDADPHNSKRGFFFAHMGWLMMKKHPDVKSKGKNIDMSDVESDPIVMFQKNYYKPIIVSSVIFLWLYVPMATWGEKLDYALSWAVFRYLLSLHFTWLVNSAAHMWGTKPYDKNISAVENMVVARLAVGEGFHNFHHAFPWDYKAGELGSYGKNWTTGFLDKCAEYGLASDFKVASKEMIQKRISRTGDGTHESFRECDIWGWEDTNMSAEDRKLVEVLHKRER